MEQIQIDVYTGLHKYLIIFHQQLDGFNSCLITIYDIVNIYGSIILELYNTKNTHTYTINKYEFIVPTIIKPDRKNGQKTGQNPL